MPRPVRFVLWALIGTTIAGGVLFLVMAPSASRPPSTDPATTRDAKARRASPGGSNATDAAIEPVIDKDKIEDGGFGMANGYMGEVHDSASLRELGELIRARGKVGLAATRATLQSFRLGPEMTREQAMQAGQLLYQLGLLEMYEGLFPEAAASFEKALDLGRSSGIPPGIRSRLMALLGIVALRRGEVDNCIACLGPSSCIFPIAPEAVHQNKEGSRQAIRRFSDYLEESPGDLRIRWLLNIAHMTLGEYPEKVPPRHLIPLDRFASKLDVGRFQNVAPLVGLTSRGPNLAGGSVFDDFNGDGLPDLFSTSLDGDRGASMFINKGDGTFEDRSDKSGLSDQVYALNVQRADYDNDGDLDLVLLRGGWERPLRLSLLRNKGDGTFDDVTIAAGLGEPITTEAAAWGDYDDDGLVDLFVCGEYLPPSGVAGDTPPDPRNRCRLYHNRGDGTFIDVAEKAGVTDERCAKGSAWGDYDGDGRLDLFVSNMNGISRLYHNRGDGTFVDVGPSLDVTGADASFACWFWDYDNDGRLDLYVNESLSSLAETAALALGLPLETAGQPRLYRNLGAEGFRDVTREVGLERPMAPMGCNLGDIDNDGFLDFYLGTGWMSYSGLVPNVLFKNVGGERFEDVTMSSGTGHLQKGHGVSFADFDEDGDLDFFVETGGAVPGDKSYNLLFRNPGHGRHWLKVRLIGTRTNRAALGARIHARIKGADGKERSIYRTVGNNSSFGGNSLVELIGLLDATRVESLTITWPTSKTTQTFRDLAADRAIAITEGTDAIKDLPQHSRKAR